MDLQSTNSQRTFDLQIYLLFEYELIHIKYSPGIRFLSSTVAIQIGNKLSNIFQLNGIERFPFCPGIATYRQICKGFQLWVAPFLIQSLVDSRRCPVSHLSVMHSSLDSKQCCFFHFECNAICSR